MPPTVGRAGAGLVRSFRFGAFATGKSRVVIETTGPVKVEATRLMREGARGAIAWRSNSCHRRAWS